MREVPLYLRCGEAAGGGYGDSVMHDRLVPPPRRRQPSPKLFDAYG